MEETINELKRLMRNLEDAIINDDYDLAAKIIVEFEYEFDALKQEL